MAEVNGPGRPLVAEPQIAMFCGHQLLHMNTETAQWEPDPQGRQGCFTLPSQILSYCQEVRLPAANASETQPQRTVMNTGA